MQHPIVWLIVTLVLSVGCTKTHAPPRPAAPAAPTRAARTPDLDLAIRREPRGDRYALVFEASFVGDASGRTAIELPSTWAGQTELWRDISAVSATGATLAPGASPHERVAVHEPRAEIVITYEIRQHDEIAEIDHRRVYRPLVQAAYFHLIGHGFVVAPAWEGDSERRIRLRWDLGDDMTMANSFGVTARAQEIDTTLDALRHAVFVGGDFRVHTLEVRGQPVHVALRGSWAFSDDDYLDRVRRVVEVERGFFGDDDFDRFLVTMIPTGARCCSYGGTGLTDSFATFIATDRPLDGRMTHLLAHELFHTWNGRRIGRQEPEELVYWFSEGFTDYYARLLSLRAGLITLAEYADSYNAVLRAYFLSPARNAQNAAVHDAFWSDEAVERLPYQRGDILAHEWNLRIQQAVPQSSIDDVMRALFAEAMSHGAVVSAEQIDTLARALLPAGVATDIQRFVDAGETLAPSDGALGACFAIEPVSIGPFDLGFDLEATDSAAALVGVRPGGPAHRAGLRDGMPIVHSRYGNDPLRPAEITVREGGQKRRVTYLPQAEAIAVPQYRLRPGVDAAHPDCAAFFTPSLR